eukprot:gene21257-4176_t
MGERLPSGLNPLASIATRGPGGKPLRAEPHRKLVALAVRRFGSDASVRFMCIGGVGCLSLITERLAARWGCSLLTDASAFNDVAALWMGGGASKAQRALSRAVADATVAPAVRAALSDLRARIDADAPPAMQLSDFGWLNESLHRQAEEALRRMRSEDRCAQHEALGKGARSLSSPLLSSPFAPPLPYIGKRRVAERRARRASRRSRGPGANDISRDQSLTSATNTFTDAAAHRPALPAAAGSPALGLTTRSTLLPASRRSDAGLLRTPRPSDGGGTHRRARLARGRRPVATIPSVPIPRGEISPSAVRKAIAELEQLKANATPQTIETYGAAIAAPVNGQRLLKDVLGHLDLVAYLDTLNNAEFFTIGDVAAVGSYADLPPQIPKEARERLILHASDVTRGDRTAKPTIALDSPGEEKESALLLDPRVGAMASESRLSLMSSNPGVRRHPGVLLRKPPGASRASASSGASGFTAQAVVSHSILPPAQAQALSCLTVQSSRTLQSIRTWNSRVEVDLERPECSKSAPWGFVFDRGLRLCTCSTGSVAEGSSRLRGCIGLRLDE